MGFVPSAPCNRVAVRVAPVAARAMPSHHCAAPWPHVAHGSRNDGTDTHPARPTEASPRSSEALVHTRTDAPPGSSPGTINREIHPRVLSTHPTHEYEDGHDIAVCVKTRATGDMNAVKHIVPKMVRVGVTARVRSLGVKQGLVRALGLLV